MVCATFDVLRAADNVLVFETSKGNTTPPQPAVTLKLWVVVEVLGAAVLSPILVEAPVSGERDAADFAKVLVGVNATNLGIDRSACSTYLCAAETYESLH